MGRRLGDDRTDKLLSYRMTLSAVARDATMVHQGPTERDCGSMAGLTSQCGGNVIGRLE